MNIERRRKEFFRLYLLKERSKATSTIRQSTIVIRHSKGPPTYEISPFADLFRLFHRGNKLDYSRPLTFQGHSKKINIDFLVVGSQNFLLHLDVKPAFEFFIEIHAGFSHFPGQNHFTIGF